MAADEPLPIDSVDIAAARWTDWPPTSSTPTLFRRDVATIDAIGDPNVVLRQTDHSDQPDPSEPRLLRPTLRPASTLAEQSKHITDVQSTSYWIAQLDSPSRLVRMKAVTELGNHGDRHAIKALRNHLNTESDHSVALLIRKRLDL
jgi:hypothetical protein